VRGRAALVKRLRGLLLASHRFAAHRARGDEDQRVAAVLVDGLRETLTRVEAGQSGRE
jgi:hypothetical protein